MSHEQYAGAHRSAESRRESPSRILDEDPFPVSEGSNHWPKVGGRKPHKSLIYRAIKKGVDGVYLEVAHVGSRMFTSDAAIARFVDEVTRRRLAAQRVDDIDDGIADAVLASAGVGKVHGGSAR